MPIVGNVIIQTQDPGAFYGFGYWWVNPTTGEAKSRNTSNTAWVDQGNWDYTNSGNMTLAGGYMTGPIITYGSGAWATVYGPNFTGTPKSNGVNLATVKDVSTSVTSFAENINNYINQALASASINIVLGDNLAISYLQAQLSGVVLSMPLFNSGIPASESDIKAKFASSYTMEFAHQTSNYDLRFLNGIGLQPEWPSAAQPADSFEIECLTYREGFLGPDIREGISNYIMVATR